MINNQLLLFALKGNRHVRWCYQLPGCVVISDECDDSSLPQTHSPIQLIWCQQPPGTVPH